MGCVWGGFGGWWCVTADRVLVDVVLVLFGHLLAPGLSFKVNVPFGYKRYQLGGVIYLTIAIIIDMITLFR